MASRVSMVLPEPDDAALAGTALAEVDLALGTSGPVRLRLEGVSGEVIVPRSAFAALGQVLAAMASGRAVGIVPVDAELTTSQAAEILKVSRPFLIGLVDAGHISYRKVGSHRRVKANSLMTYLRNDTSVREAAADDLAAETYELGMI